jgi:hypothetical protein
VDLTATGDVPNVFHAVATDAVDLVVHVHGAANVVGNDRELVADAITAFGVGEIQVPVLFRKAFDLDGGIVFDESEATSVFGLVTIGRKRF